MPAKGYTSPLAEGIALSRFVVTWRSNWRPTATYDTSAAIATAIPTAAPTRMLMRLRKLTWRNQDRAGSLALSSCLTASSCLGDLRSLSLFDRADGELFGRLARPAPGQYPRAAGAGLARLVGR